MKEDFICGIQKYQKIINKIHKKYGLYVGNYESLELLIKHPKGVLQRSLAEYLGISKATAGVALKKMEKAGYVNRHGHPADKRGILVTLTNEGLDVYKKVHKEQDNILSKIFPDDQCPESVKNFVDNFLKAVR